MVGTSPRALFSVSLQLAMAFLRGTVPSQPQEAGGRHKGHRNSETHPPPSFFGFPCLVFIWCSGLERWLCGEEHGVALTGLEFGSQHPCRKLTTPSPGESDALFWPL